LAIVQPIISYFLDRKHLRKFPAPSYAGFSTIWRIIQNLNYRHYLAVHQAHQELGTHVRIAPNHISVSDPKAMNDIYGHGANFLKDAWYDGGAGEYRHMADSRIKSEHQAKRKMFAHVFAQKTIANLEPVVTGKAALLVSQIDKKASAGEMVNLRRYLNYFTIDLISELLYGESLGCLNRGNDIVNAETKEGKVYQVPFIKSLHDATIINTVLGFEAPLLPWTKKLFAWHPYKKAGADFDNIIYHNTMKRFRNEDSGNDFFQKLLTNSRGEKLDLAVGEILAECSVMMNAGSDTTTAALTGTIYLLYKHPRVLRKLREELGSTIGSEEVPKYDTVANLPYLKACIEESLRFRPASSMGLPRVVPQGGRTIAGRFVEEGVTVSVPTYTLLRDQEAFESPNTFNPDRWIEGDKEKMSKAHLPFSTGPRACIGRNIAYFEQIILIATLVHLFDFEFSHEGFELKTLERFNSNPDELVLKCRRRS
jgi:cytochrome P450